jgi:hypothetical protein
MVVMFVDCCIGGGRYFTYYSYRRNPTGWEIFVPAGTLIVVKLFKKVNASWSLYRVRLAIVKLADNMAWYLFIGPV